MTDPLPPPVDVQDPLPEANWLWRRVFTFVAVAVILGILIGLAIATNRIVGNVVGRIDTMSAVAVADIAKQALVVILRMFTLMFWALMVTITYYMIAPSAEQITKMLQTAGLLKAGVQMASRTVETPERREIAATVGTPPQPVSPPVDGVGSDHPYETPENSPRNGVRSDETGLDGTWVASSPEIAPTGVSGDEEDFAPRSRA